MVVRGSVGSDTDRSGQRIELLLCNRVMRHGSGEITGLWSIMDRGRIISEEFFGYEPETFVVMVAISIAGVYSAKLSAAFVIGVVALNMYSEGAGTRVVVYIFFITVMLLIVIINIGTFGLLSDIASKK